MFRRLNRLFKTFFNMLFGKVEDKLTIPQMESALREMQENLMKYKEAVASSMAYESQAQRKYNEEVKYYNSLGEKAKLAAQKSLNTKSRKEKKEMELLAKRALGLRHESANRREMLKKTWNDAKAQAETARNQFELAADEVEKRARQLNQAKTLDELNRTRRELADLSGQFDIESASAVFDKGMESIIQEREKLHSMETLSQSEGTELDVKLDDLVMKDKVDEEFQELVSQLNKESSQEELPEKKDEKLNRDIDSALE